MPILSDGHGPHEVAAIDGLAYIDVGLAGLRIVRLETLGLSVYL